MVLPPRTNFGRSGVTSSIASTDTSISVTDASVFSDPANGNFVVTVFDAGAGPTPTQVGSGSRERVTVTAKDTTADTLTVTRGTGDTTATSLPDTSVVIETADAADFDAVDTALESIASYSGGTADHLTAQVGASSNRQDVFVGSVDAQSVNNVPYAEPGEVQSTINDANTADVGVGFDKSKQVVKLKSGTVYDEGEEITVPPGIILDLNQANLGNSQNGGDHNIVYLDNGAELRNGFIGIDGSTFTSDAVVLDTSRSSLGRYALGAATAPSAGETAIGGRETRIENVKIQGDVNNTPGGVGVAFRDSASIGIFVGTRCDVRVFRMDRGVELEATDDGSGGKGVNFDPSAVSIVGCTTLINHVGDAQARTPFTGHLQPAGPCEYGIRNQTTADSVSFEGTFFDPVNASINANAGPNIRVNNWHHNNADWLSTSDGSDGQLITYYQPFSQRTHTAIPADGIDWTIQHRFSDRQRQLNGTNIWKWNQNDGLQLDTGYLQTPSGSGTDAALRVGSNGAGFYEATDGDPEAVDDAGNTSTIGTL